VQYNIFNDTVSVGVSDEDYVTNSSAPHSILVDNNKVQTYITNPNVYKEIRVSSLNIRTVKLAKLPWYAMSFVADDYDSLDQEQDYRLGSANSSDSDPNSWYQISRIYDLPTVFRHDLLNDNFFVQVNLNFDEIIKY